MSAPDGYIKGEFTQPKTRWGKTKRWMVRHQEAIMLVCFSVVVVGGMATVIKVDANYRARLAAAEQRMVESLNGLAEAERALGAQIYPINAS